jgi:ferredoxin
MAKKQRKADGQSGQYHANPRFTALFPEVSGNTVNGLGETTYRKASPSFWHPPERQTHGELQQAMVSYHSQSPEIREVYNPKADRGPRPVERAAEQVQKSPAQWRDEIRRFVLENEGDMVGITPMREEYIFEGYEIGERTVIMIGVSMDYEELSKAPASFEEPAAGVEVGRQYNRASRVARRLTNHLLAQGHHARAWPGPYASALNMIPAAIAAGLGELGKHGSMINREFGSCFRLSAVTTDVPLEHDAPEDIGADDFCLNCQVCVNACPPDAIYNEKQMVRGVEKWYVDFDKCIPYFGDTLACGICVAVCPWSYPQRGPKLSEKMLRRRARKGLPGAAR